MFGNFHRTTVLESIDETTDHIIAYGGAIMASQKVKPSVPGKKAEAKTSKPLKLAKAFRSAEFIEDSDEEATKVVRKKQTPKAVPPSTKLIRPKADTSITKPSKKRKALSPSPEKEESTQSDTEEERSSHSGDGSENEESSSAQDGSPTPARPKESASRPATNSAAIEDSVGKSQLNKPKAPEKSSVRRTPSPRTASPSESEEDSESSAGGDESGSESESSDQTSRKGPRKESSILTQENTIFEPPPGFEPASIFVHPSSQAMDMFSPTNRAGKEIWHITAPSSVPISSIKEVSQQSILARSSILSYEGSNYGLVPNSSTDEALLLPSAEDNDYKSHNAAALQSFHLQQIVSLPYHALSPAKSSSQSAPIPQAYKRAPREQPEGLKMRYHPFGVVDISDDDLSSKDVPKVPQFRVPGAVDATPAEKRKRFSIDSSKVKSKKAKIRQEATVNGHDDVMDIDTVDQPASQKQDASKAKANGISENHTPKSAKPKKTKPKATDKKPDHSPHQSAASQSLLPADIAEKAEIIMPEEVVTNGASAMEITASEEKKTKRKRRKEAAKAAEKENAAKADVDVEIQDVESPSRASEGHSATPGKSSAQKQANAANGAVDEVQATPQETKEERRKRKEEKRKRKREAGQV